jgi:hypothetical protein
MADMIKVLFTGTNESRNATGAIRLPDRPDLLIDEEGEVTPEELTKLMGHGMTFEILTGSSKVKPLAKALEAQESAKTTAT